VYQFTLENTSKELDVVDEEKEWKIYNEYYTKWVKVSSRLLALCLLTSFINQKVADEND
jgi:hypothetical protein